MCLTFFYQNMLVLKREKKLHKSRPLSISLSFCWKIPQAWGKLRNFFWNFSRARKFPSIIFSLIMWSENFTCHFLPPPHSTAAITKAFPHFLFLKVSFNFSHVMFTLHSRYNMPSAASAHWQMFYWWMKEVAIDFPAAANFPIKIETSRSVVKRRKIKKVASFWKFKMKENCLEIIKFLFIWNFDRTQKTYILSEYFSSSSFFDCFTSSSAFAFNNVAINNNMINGDEKEKFFFSFKLLRTISKIQVREREIFLYLWL